MRCDEQRGRSGLGGYPTKDNKLDFPLRKDRFVLICHPQHPLARNSASPQSRFRPEFIRVRAGHPDAQSAGQNPEGERRERQHVMEFDNIETVKRAVEIDAAWPSCPREPLSRKSASTLSPGGSRRRRLLPALAAIYKKKRSSPSHGSSSWQS